MASQLHHLAYYKTCIPGTIVDSISCIVSLFNLYIYIHITRAFFVYIYIYQLYQTVFFSRFFAFFGKPLPRFTPRSLDSRWSPNLPKGDEEVAEANLMRERLKKLESLGKRYSRWGPPYSRYNKVGK